jgi:hypothetical protein
VPIDPRGPRFAAGVTSVVLTVALLGEFGWLLAVQAGLFAVGAIAGLDYSPYTWLYRRFIRSRLPPPAELEMEAAPRFAQGMGLAFAGAGALGFLTGVTALGVAATAMALAAAFLSAAFGLCMGCETYLFFRRLAPQRASAPRT